LSGLKIKSIIILFLLTHSQDNTHNEYYNSKVKPPSTSLL
jgi:hypothetical protein